MYLIIPKKTANLAAKVDDDFAERFGRAAELIGYTRSQLLIKLATAGVNAIELTKGDIRFPIRIVIPPEYEAARERVRSSKTA